MSSVDFALGTKWFKPNREMIYLVTGYGSINSSLHNRGLIEDKNCKTCRQEETVEHMFFDSRFYRDVRSGLMERVRSKKNLLIEENFKHLLIFAKDLSEKRKDACQ